MITELACCATAYFRTYFPWIGAEADANTFLIPAQGPVLFHLAIQDAAVMTMPRPYRSFADSPWQSLVQNGFVGLETFNDRPADYTLPFDRSSSVAFGLSKPNPLYALDGDDAALDGRVRGGKGLAASDNRLTIVFEFERDANGNLPTRLGFAITAMQGLATLPNDMSFTVWDTDGKEVIRYWGSNTDFDSTLFSPTSRDPSNDQFVGFYVPNGISKFSGVRLQAFDDLHLGFPVIPEPSTGIFALTAIGAFFRRRRTQTKD
jgi:hypothetical protein